MTSDTRTAILENIDILLKCETKWGMFRWMTDADIEAARVVLRRLQVAFADGHYGDMLELRASHHSINDKFVLWKAWTKVTGHDDKVIFLDIHIKKECTAGRGCLIPNKGEF